MARYFDHSSHLYQPVQDTNLLGTDGIPPAKFSRAKFPGHPQNHGLYSRITGFDDIVDAVEQEIAYETASSTTSLVRRKPLPTTTPQQLEKPTWLPYALRWYWLLAVLSLGSILLMATLTLHFVSNRHHGLALDHERSDIYFLYRFMPTLLAVVYATMLMILLDAVKRTEPFARLSAPEGANAGSTIMKSSGPWWTTLVDSLPSRRHGRRFSPTMFGATVAYILATLVISSFSSAFLAVHEVVVSTSTGFNVAQLPSSQLLSQGLDTQDYFQTIGHMLQNVTTSPWITDEYVVVPFWPTSGERKSGLDLVADSEAWTMETTVLQVDTACQNLPLQAGPLTNKNFTYTFASNYTASTNLTSYQFANEHGCQYGVVSDTFGEFNHGTIPEIYGVMYWSNLSAPSVDLFSNLLDSTNVDPELLLNHTAQCNGDIVIILPSNNSTLPAAAHLCTSTYYQAVVPVTLASSNGFSTATFSNETFMQSRTSVDTRQFNITAFESSFLGQLWNQHLLGPQDFNVNNPQFTGGRPALGGPANVLAGIYDFNLDRLLQDPVYMSNAQRLKQRTFGQAVSSALATTTASITGTGQMHETARKISVSPTAAIVLEVSIATTILLGLIVLASSRLSRRPLGLSQDPAFTNTIAAMSSRNIPSSLALRMQGDPQRCSLDPSKKMVVRGGAIEAEVGDPLQTKPDHTTWREHKSNVNPFTLSTPVIILLLVYLSALLATIAVLYWYSRTHGIRKDAITPHFILGQSTGSVMTVAPYAVVPTLLVVCLGLWWGALEGVFRIAQPFIAMSRKATSSARGSGLSYQSSYLAWAAARAASRRHWLLLFVCAGASLSQILTIAISALWNPVVQQNQRSVMFAQPLQIREVPIVFSGDSYRVNGRQDLTTQIFSNLTTDFMFGALSEIKFNASQPAWSKDDWSFLPIQVDRTALGGLRDSSQGGLNGVSQTLQIDTQAIRARLECSPFEQQVGPEYYTREANMTGANLTQGPPILGKGYTLTTALALEPYNLSALYYNTTKTYDDFRGTTVGTPATNMLEVGVRMSCCAGDSNGNPSEAVVGYWTSTDLNLNTSSYSKPTEESLRNSLATYQNFNFTTKWIYGRSPSNYIIDPWYSPQLIWPEPPKISLVNCMPIIESAPARVTVDTGSLQVRNYTIASNPTPYPYAWRDNFVQRRQNESSGNFNRTYTTSFAPLFLYSLLGAGQIQFHGGCFDHSGQSCHEGDDDRVYNIKQPGLNVDFMSYAMLSLVNDTFTQLLDSDVMTRAAQKVFPIFFKHFVGRTSATDTKGGWVYQLPNETVPADLGPAGYPENQTALSPARVTNPPPASITAILSDPVEMLEMSPAAVWISIVILVWLFITVGFVLVLKDRYFKPLLRGVDTIFDTMVMVAGSERYLELASTKGATGLRRDKTFRTRLGWFRTRSGHIRWGIELADHPDVEFLNEAEVAEYLSPSTGPIQDLSDGHFPTHGLNGEEYHEMERLHDQDEELEERRCRTDTRWMRSPPTEE